jgi:TPR repeat protein
MTCRITGIFVLFNALIDYAYVDRDRFFYYVSQEINTSDNRNGEVGFSDLANIVIREIPKTVIVLLGDEQTQNPFVNVPNQSLPIFLITKSDRDVLVDYQAFEKWRNERGTSVGFIKENGARRVRIWKDAAEGGSPKGMLLYARCLLEGSGVEKNEGEAIIWIRKAVGLGDADAMYDLCVCFYTGMGLKRDMNEVMKWMRKAVELGSPRAMNNLGFCYFNGEGVERNVDEGLKWFRKAAELGNRQSMTTLGACYFKGEGVSKDAVEGVKWFRKAAELNTSMAMNNLGVCYRDGEGVTKDLSEAVKWFRKAAELGNPKAMYNLGAGYFSGCGAKDEVEAVKYLREASELGLAEAKALLKQLGKD